jgi:hypothetical protein
MPPKKQACQQYEEDAPAPQKSRNNEMRLQLRTSQAKMAPALHIW